jgi:hypothetical protein
LFFSELSGKRRKKKPEQTRESARALLPVCALPAMLAARGRVNLQLGYETVEPLSSDTKCAVDTPHSMQHAQAARHTGGRSKNA